MPSTPVMDRLIRRTVEHHLPWNVHFDVTYRCNERCLHCYLDHDDLGELSTLEVRSILGEVAAAGTLFLTVSGGEIFLRKDIFDLLAYAKALHFDLSLKTNALLINADRAARLRDLGVRRVQVSIYSANAEVHDAVTKVRGSFARSIQAIRFLMSQGLRVKIACPVMKQNLIAYRGVQSLAEELGVPYIFDLTITPRLDGGTGVLAYRATTEELLPVLQDAVLNPPGVSMAEAASQGGTITSGSASAHESDAYDDIPCCAGQNSCYISPYGDVYPCVQMPLPAGNLRRQRFEEIWNESAVLRRVRAIRESDLPLCSHCSIRRHCERCPGLAQMEGGGLVGAYERACELAEANARLAGVQNPVSALHEQQAHRPVKRGRVPEGLVGIQPVTATAAWER